MHTRWLSLLILVLFITGGVAIAQDGTTQVVTGQPTDLTVVATIQYGDALYEIAAGDGPILGYVDALIETEAGVEVVGTLLVHDHTGWRVVGPWVDPAPSEYATASAGDVLPLALPEQPRVRQ